MFDKHSIPEGTMIMPGMDDALVGWVTEQGVNRSVYDYDKLIQVLEADMSYLDAVEYFDFNIARSLIGNTYPIIRGWE